ncbi:MAG: hypothetical protein HFJ41_07875, partial [Clostridia bacterium]|nr:hypothetical protein [Clostridia bacterium]
MWNLFSYLPLFLSDTRPEYAESYVAIFAFCLIAGNLASILHVIEPSPNYQWQFIRGGKYVCISMKSKGEGKLMIKQAKKIWEKRNKDISASYTVEAAGVMAIVLFSIMVLLNQSFHVRAETVGKFSVHEEVERERHAISNADNKEVTRQAQGMRWGLEVTAPIFRPEKSLR